MPHSTTNSGLHEFVTEHVLLKRVKKGFRAADLGSGPGAMATRLHSLGCLVLAVDRAADDFEADLPHVAVDLNECHFAERVGLASFDLITAIEVIEHLESPIGFLRNVGLLLAEDGVAVITTPNVDSLPARVKFLLTGKIRAMDEFSEPTHISPIFSDLLHRQFLPRSGLRLREHLIFPVRGYQLSRSLVSRAFRIADTFISSRAVRGDNHIFVLQKARCS
jgi:2-polyprenyl-3-methyl-5-hydroxy-6-metoxy-1,4-benzoquinol methylase